MSKLPRGTDVARAAGNIHHADAIEAMMQQLLIALFKRLDADVSPVAVPVAEVDDTGGWLLAFRLDAKDRVFYFELQRKA